MGGDQTGASQEQAATGAYTNLANEGNLVFSQVEPMLVKMLPMLWSTLTGKNTALTEAARAPVIGQTEQNIATMQNNAGASANPNAASQDMSQKGAQAAGLAGDANLQAVMTALSGLITSGQNFSGSALTNSGNGLASLGTNMAAQNQDMWKNIFSAVGNVAGAAFGVPGAGGSGATPTGENAPAPDGFSSGVGTYGQAVNNSTMPGAGMPDVYSPPGGWDSASGITPNYNSTGGSTPISASGIIPAQTP